MSADNSLNALKQTGTVVVSDSGDFESIAQYQPQDATTNPSLILAATKEAKYEKLFEPALAYAKEKGGDIETQTANATDRLLVEFGKQILALIPGRVSTEVDARLSFDTEATIEKAKTLIALYESVGVSKDRVLIKIASTYEGIQAARYLEKELDIHCNLTLLFGFGQAVACAEANVTLISPFVGRIMDWYKAKTGKTYSGEEDPGVLSVSKIWAYYKNFGYKTIVMGASFRNVDEIKALAGVDYLTIAPKLLEELRNSTDKVEKKLDISQVGKGEKIEKLTFVDDKPKFQWELLQDEMAWDKLHQGIRQFGIDCTTLEDVIRSKLQ